MNVKQKQGKLIVHACGGAGINISNNVISQVSELGKGYAVMEFNYLDTSNSNLLQHNNDAFFKVNTSDFGKDIDGSGGERATNSAAIITSVKDYLNDNNITESKVGEYHLVVFSASGGSGSVIGPVLINNLLSRDIPTIALVVSDSSNALNAVNTMNTLATLDNMAKRSNKALSILYANNHTMDMDSLSSGQELVDEAVYTSVKILSLFLSGNNKFLDSQDMLTFIDSSSYNRINVKPGLYSIMTHRGEVHKDDDVTVIVGRTLTTGNASPDINVDLLHHKSGIVVDENVVEDFGTDTTLHLVSTINFLDKEIAYLNSVIKRYKSIMENLEISTIHGDEDSAMDDSGLIF